ncbi:hypothetical protein Q4610_17720 [Sphingobium sp. HBC34]|jgi:hypothetical protein|uniref:Uncharacterized protein n=1 Tax=Sphingobium cyanobacteriorum TaxID=3063954 RepID=A0ABT8ZS14_9SPHN|nr:MULTISPECIES: hypothetical protein [Sphingomonadaceae]MDO7836888.1 hypothetical protein [Sphingobium sp. HBC34]
MNSEAIMARTIEEEMESLREEERRLASKKAQLVKRARDEAIKSVEKTGLLKLESRRLEALAGRIKSLGIEEVEKRLAA